jgi:hypothetical protein
MPSAASELGWIRSGPELKDLAGRTLLRLGVDAEHVESSTIDGAPVLRLRFVARQAGALLEFFFGRQERRVTIHKDGASCEGLLDTEWIEGRRSWSVRFDGITGRRQLNWS